MGDTVCHYQRSRCVCNAKCFQSHSMQAVSLLLVLSAVMQKSWQGWVEWFSNKRNIVHILDVWHATIPACSQRLTKYQPRLAPVWGPDIAWNAMISEMSGHWDAARIFVLEVFIQTTSLRTINNLTWILINERVVDEGWYVVTERMSALLAFGCITTKQFLNADLFATARFCQTM